MHELLRVVVDSTLALWLPVLVNRLRRYSFCKAAGGACGVNSGVFQFIPVVLGTGHRELWIRANGFANLGVSRLTSLRYGSGSPDSLVTETTISLWWWVVVALCRGHWSLTWRIFFCFFGEAVQVGGGRG